MKAPNVADLVFLRKVGKRKVNMVVQVSKVKEYKDGSFSIYHVTNEGDEKRLWSKVIKGTRMGGAKLVGFNI